MKKLTALLMGLILMLNLAAFAGTGVAEEAAAAEPAEATAEPAEATAAPEDGASEDAAEPAGNLLVVYFSATGNTEAAANYIAEATGADVFVLEPVEPYTDEDLNWTDENSRVVYEHDNPDDRAVALVADTVENWDQYDTVFIGYPIWLAYHKLIQCTQIA